jgi:ABC-type dipeptide/oligopeptide/nickel transport system ATPase subunit
MITAPFLTKEVSGGQCQRIALIRALSVSPKLLLCDEITSALDGKSQTEIIELLKKLHLQYGIAVVFVTHDQTLAESFCNRILRMNTLKS